MGQIIKTHDQVFAPPVQMTEQQRQAKEMGARYIGARNPLPMPEMSLKDFIDRQHRRMEGAK